MSKNKALSPEDFGANAQVFVNADTLAGDVRDALLSHLKTIRVPWAMLAEDEQRDKIYAVENTAKTLVRECVSAIAQRGFPHVAVMVGKTVMGDGLKIDLSAANTIDNVTKIATHGKMGAVLVLAESAQFLGERAPARPDKDQPDLPMDDKED